MAWVSGEAEEYQEMVIITCEDRGALITPCLRGRLVQKGKCYLLLLFEAEAVDKKYPGLMVIKIIKTR